MYLVGVPCLSSVPGMSLEDDRLQCQQLWSPGRPAGALGECVCGKGKVPFCVLPQPFVCVYMYTEHTAYGVNCMVALINK